MSPIKLPKDKRYEVTVQVKVIVTSTANRGTVEMLALEASSHNEYDPDVSSVLERKYGTAEVADQTIIGYDELNELGEAKGG